MNHYEFVECPACAAKPGSPVLCPSCLRNRDVIAWQRARIEQLEAILSYIRGLTGQAQNTRPV